MFFKGKEIFQKRIFKIFESEYKIHILILLERLIKIFVLKPLNMLIKLPEEIRKVIYLCKSKLKLDQHLFDIIYMISRLFPTNSHLLQQSFLLLISKSLLLLFMKNKNQLKQIVLLLA